MPQAAPEKAKAERGNPHVSAILENLQSLFAADGDPDRARDAAEWALIQLGDRAQHSSTFDPETTLVLMEIGRDVQERRRKREQ